MKIKRYQTYYETKFAREAQSKPTHWVVVGVGTPQRPSYELRYMPPITHQQQREAL